MKIQLAAIALTLLVGAQSANANPFSFAEHEFDKLKLAAHQATKVVNSYTLRAARKMCLVTANKALEDKGITAVKFSEVAAHCASGNLNHALELMGGTIHDDVVHNIHTLQGGVVRHIHKWEHEAITAWDNVKLPLK
jgi:hypothetical protein